MAKKKKTGRSWAEYEWQYEGKPSVVRVNMDPFSGMAERNARPLLLLIRLSTRKNYALELISPIQKLRLEMLYNRFYGAAKRAGALSVGCRTWGSSMMIYCYCTDEPQALPLIKLCEKRRWVLCECETRTDPEWRVYRRDIYPNAPQLQTMQNSETIALMRDRGDDLHSPRRINHYCSFPDEVCRIGFQQAARKAGFALGDPAFLPENDMPHMTCVRNIGSIEKRAIDQVTTRVVLLCERYHGRYDYWDCQIMRKNRIKKR